MTTETNSLTVWSFLFNNTNIFILILSYMLNANITKTIGILGKKF